MTDSVDFSDLPRPADHKLLSRTVADWIATRIIAGVEAPGERLVESKLAELAGVSRSPVREALRILAREGLVEIVPRIGAQVVEIGSHDVRDLYACRMLLEPRCTYEAVETLTAVEVAVLDAIRLAMEQAVAAADSKAFLAENVAYFHTLVAYCPNEHLRELVQLCWTRSRRYWSLLARLPSYSEGSLEQHVLLHRAVKARDAARAESANRSILERALREILVTVDHDAAAAAEERALG
jgi:DNA-binding GntR family transcriptional regulator